MNMLVETAFLLFVFINRKQDPKRNSDYIPIHHCHAQRTGISPVKLLREPSQGELVRHAPDPALLIAQLPALISNPNVFAEHKKTIQDLTHKTSLAFYGRHETMQRIIFSVLAPPSPDKLPLQPLPNVLAYVGQEHGISKTTVEAAEPSSFQVLAANSDIGQMSCMLYSIVWFTKI
jgi:hypothetical protein